MSVDIAQLTARLDAERREAVKSQYEERATNATVAFLLCFFLGSAGAHRFYLREWRVGFAHLTLFVVGAAALIAGLVQTIPLTTQLSTHPAGFALDVVGVVLLLAALIWEIIDLGRIDHQVYQRNLLLAEGIIAGTLLADHSVIDSARHKLAEISAQTHGQAQAEAAPTVAAAAGAAGAAGIITADQVADARTLAEEAGSYSAISYTEVSRLDVSEDPDQARQASADAAHEGSWTESATIAGPVESATPDAAPTVASETVTRTHLEDGPRVTDSYEVDRAEGPSAAELAGFGAAGLGAAALGAGLYEAAHGATAAPETPETPETYSAGFDETTQPDAAYADYAEPEAAAYAEPQAAEPAYPAYQDSAYGAYTFDDDDIGDVTDASMPAVVVPAADIAVANATPAYVQLDGEQPEPTDLSSSGAPAEEAPLYLIPEEPDAQVYPYASEPSYDTATYAAPAYEPPTYDAPAYGASAYDAAAYDEPESAEPPADAYVPPVAPVFSAPAEEPAPPTPSWDQPTYAEPAPEPQPEPQPAYDDTLAELAGFAGLAGAGALAGDAFVHHHAAEPVAESMPEPQPEPEPAAPEAVAASPEPEPVAAPVAPAAPEPPKMKRIRVRRKVVVDGQVVAEEVVEREVPADMDTATAAAQIQAELTHATPEQIAQLAHLSPDEEVQVRQRTEGPSLGE